MIRHALIFLGTFAGGALLALVVRAALFDPHAGHGATPVRSPDYAPMVSNPLTPASPAAPASHSPGNAPAASTAATPATAPAATTVNSVCAICGMQVDPTLPTLEYQGKTIGFGCKMCAPKFKADPDRYGPAYLRNEVLRK